MNKKSLIIIIILVLATGYFLGQYSINKTSNTSVKLQMLEIEERMETVEDIKLGCEGLIVAKHIERDSGEEDSYINNYEQRCLKAVQFEEWITELVAEPQLQNTKKHSLNLEIL